MILHTMKIEMEIGIHTFVIFITFLDSSLRIIFSQVIIEATNACRNVRNNKYT